MESSNMLYRTGNAGACDKHFMSIFTGSADERRQLFKFEYVPNNKPLTDMTSERFT